MPCVAQPAQISGNLHFTTLTAAGNLVCGIERSGTILCWSAGLRGLNVPGPHYAGAAGTPTGIYGSWDDHLCALTTDGAAYCGRDSGLLPVPGNLRFTSISVTALLAPHQTVIDFQCGLTSERTAYCWSMTVGQTSPTIVPGGFHFVALAPWNANQCGLTTDGAIYWSLNYGAQWRVPSSHGFVRLAGHSGHLCAIDVASRTFCWGGNAMGQLGDGSLASEDGPTPVIASVP